MEIPVSRDDMDKRPAVVPKHGDDFGVSGFNFERGVYIQTPLALFCHARPFTAVQSIAM